MRGFLKILEGLADFEDLVNSVKYKDDAVSLTGLADSSAVHIIAGLSEKLEKKSLIVVNNEVEAKRIYEDLNFFDRGNVIMFPESDLIFYDIEAVGRDILKERLNVLDKLIRNGSKYHIITTVSALRSVTASLEIYKKYTLEFKVGDEISLTDLANRMVTLGYRREEMVEGAGQFSIRGGIFDFYPFWSETAYRVEFFDYEVDSIRLFDTESQRTITKLDEARITPAFEIIMDEKTRINLMSELDEKVSLMHNYENDPVKEKLISSVKRDIERLGSGEIFPSIYKYIPYIYGDKLSSILDYIEEKLIFMIEPSRIYDTASAEDNRFSDSYSELIQRGIVLGGSGKYFEDYDRLLEKLKNKGKVILINSLSHSVYGFKNVKTIGFTAKSLNNYGGKMEFFYDALSFYKKNGYGILILAGSESRCANLQRQLEDEEIISAVSKEFINPPASGSIVITHGSLNRGFEYPLIRMVVISDRDIFGGERKKSKRRKGLRKQDKLESFTDLNIGDYVVHKNHGIGQYVGINRLSVEGVKKDYLKIKYKGEDILYVPTDQLDMIYKHIGKEGARVKINKLGSQDWNKTKSRVKASCADMAKDLIALYAQRQSIKGISFKEDTEWQRDFEAAFLYDETDDQLRSIEEVKRDMESEKPMDRLLCGDVGYGKTEVALRAAFKAVMSGYQVAYLVPTTILANQHFNTFRQRMKDYPINIAMLSRFCTSAQEKAVKRELKTGEVDIVIGTHKILQKTVEFSKLGLLIIDEEQRFGVAHKERIKEIRKDVDALTLSATPIPRTLHMSMSGLRDMSVINQPPSERYPVATYVLEYNEDVIYEAINKELGRGGQVYYMFNRVQGIYSVAERISELIPSARVSVAHGKMNESELENIMMELSEGEIDILVCTTIIETGLDIPNVNTIIIEDADRLGLSQLYQLRGRVGRSNRLAYAYLTFKRDKALNETAEKRLRAIKEFTEFGSGFKVAMRDLEIRGMGNLIGAQQSGHMETVGYEMYCRLLEEAINEQRGIETVEKVETSIDLSVSAYIPEEFIGVHSHRMSAYKKIASILTQEDLYDVYEEIEDRYGSIPEVVHNLMQVALIKALASASNITDIKEREKEVLFFFAPDRTPDMQKVAELCVELSGYIKIVNNAKPYISYKIMHKNNDFKYLEAIKEFLIKVSA